MRRFPFIFSNRILLAISVATIIAVLQSPGATLGGDPPIVVTNTNDSGPGSLRAAILSAFGGAQIHFNIPDSDPRCETNGTCTIKPLTPLPPLSDNGLVLDGFTQPGATPNTLVPGQLINTNYDIFLDGSSIVDDADGLQISANNVTVRGIVINYFTEDGISIDFSATGAKIEGNALFLNESDGVSVNGDFNTIGGTTNAARNLMSINGDDGINLSGDGNLVQNNLVGLHPEDPEAIPNGAAGIHIFGRDNTVGGSTAGRNVISGNANSGVRIGPSLGFVAQGFVTPSGNTVSYNYIGTDPQAAAALPNEGPGISIGLSEDSFIGPSNVISGNAGDGVSIGASALRVSILGNRIGTDAAGNNDVPNLHGVGVYGGADTTIGGPLNGHGNLLSGNTGNGIIVSFAGDVDIGGNLIGTTANGEAALGNGSYGVLADNASDVGIGGDFGPNTIAFNGLDGVAIGGMSASIGALSNSIYANTLLGIDLGGGNVTPNDPLDADLGPNNTQNFPDLEAAVTSDNVHITGTIRGTPGANLRIEFFRNVDCDPSGFGEGEEYLGSIQRTIDGDGVLPFAVTSEGSIPPGNGITATATDLQLLQTSEFSNCVIVQGTATPTLTVSATPTPSDTTTPTPTGETATPTQTPTDTGTATPTEPAGHLWGDSDCGGEISSRDNQALLRHVLDQPALSRTEPCPDLGDTIDGRLWGDWDCSGVIGARDNQALLRHVLSQPPLSQTEPCPDIGSPVA